MRIKNISTLAFIILTAATFYSATQKSNGTKAFVSVEEFDRVPPKATEFKIQKLLTPLSDSSNAIFRVQYEYYDTLPSEFIIYQPGDSIVLKDDGVYPDSFAQDSEYAGYVRIDIESFRNEIIQKETTIFSNGPLILNDSPFT